MSGKPTFHMGRDWVALLELGPAARTVLDLMHCNALFGRGGIVTHTVHVTSAWFTEMTAHWQKPMSGATARRGMNELIERGVLVRLNDPNDGAGFVVRFVPDPDPEYTGPVNGFEHAKKVSSKCGLKAIYERRDASGLLPTESRSPSKSSSAGGGGDLAKELEQDSWADIEPEPDVEPDPPQEETEFDLSGLDRLGEPSPEKPTGPMAEFAAELESATSQKSEEKLRLMTGACRRIAVAVGPALERGWGARELAIRLAAELNPKIHSPEKLLLRKIEDLGDPPVRVARTKDEVIIGGKAVDLGSYDMGFGHDAAPAPVGKKESPPDGETKEDRLRRIARMAGRRK